MAAANDAASDIHKDPNFAVICSFIERYGELLELPQLSFSDLQRYIEDTRSVNRNLQELLLKLLKRWKRSFTIEKWQRHLVKFAFFCSDVDGWELEKFGFPRCKLSTKLRIIKNLLEVQFDTNIKFKEKINEKSSQELRFLPLGRDKNGLAYWYLIDKEFNLRIYREEQDDVEAETWEMVVSDRNSLVGLIGRLVQDQNKSRSATPSSQEGENSQDGSLLLKVELQESQHGGESINVKLKAETDDVKLKNVEVRVELDDIKCEGGLVKYEKEKTSRSTDKVGSTKVKDEPVTNIKEERDVKDEKNTADAQTDVKIKTEPLNSTDDHHETKTHEDGEGIDEVSSEKRGEGNESKANNDLSLEKKDIRDQEREDGERQQKQEAPSEDGEKDGKVDSSETLKPLKERADDDSPRVDDAGGTEEDEASEEKQTEDVEKEKEMGGDVEEKDQEQSDKETESQKERCCDKGEGNDLKQDVIDDGEETKDDKREVKDDKREVKDDKQEVKDDKQEVKHDKRGETGDSDGVQVANADKQEVRNDDLRTSRESEKESDKKSDEEAEKAADERNEKEQSSDSKKDPENETKERRETSSEIEDTSGERSESETKDETEETVDKETGKTSEDETGEGRENEITNKTESVITEEVENGEKSEKEETLSTIVERSDKQTADLVDEEGGQEEVRKEDEQATTSEKEDVDKSNQKGDGNDPESRSVVTTDRKDGGESKGEKVSTSEKQSKKEEDRKEVKPSDVTRSKRKRGRDDDKKEQAAEKSDLESNDESEISDSQTDPGSEANSDEPPSKRKRDKMLKKASSRTRGRHVAKAEDSVEEQSASERSPPAKKQQKDGENSDEKFTEKTTADATESNAVNTEENDDKTQSGSDKENVKKRGRGAGIVKEEASDYEPSSKKGRPAVGGLNRGRGRGRGRPRGGGVGRSMAHQEEAAEDSDDVPLIQLRRSTRSNKGQRVIEPLYTLEQPRRKQSKKAQEQEQQQLKKQMEIAAKAAKKDQKKDKKKKRKEKYDSDDDFVPGKNGYKKRTRRKNASYTDESDDEDDDLFDEEEDVSSLHFSSGSSSEVEVDCDSEEYQPQGRNAKRAAAICHKKAVAEPEFEDDDASCCKCGKGNHPELILLCDKCDSGYHTACLRPPLMIIPDGDWFCPPCEHVKLIENLQNQLKDLDTQMKAKERLVKRKERLAYVGISLDNILPDHGEKEEQTEEDIVETARQRRRERHKRQREREYYPWEIESQYKMTRGYREYSDSDSQVSESQSQSESGDDDEEEESTPEEEHWLVTRRSRRERKEISYKFDEYDNIINSAIKEQVQEVEGTAAEETQPVSEDGQQCSGKEGSVSSSAEPPLTVPMPKVTRKPRSGGKDMSNIPGFKEEEEQDDGRPPPVVRKRKKGRRLTALDSDAAEEGDDSEEYKASDDTLISDYEDEIPSEDSVSDDWMNEHCRKQSRRSCGTRRSRRKRGRRKWDDDFVVDNDYESEEDDDSCYRRTRRCVSRRQVSYKEDSGSDSQASGYTAHRSQKTPQSRRKRVIVAESGDEENDGIGKRPSWGKKYGEDSGSDSQGSGRTSRHSRKTPQSGHKRVILTDSGDEEVGGNGKSRSRGKKYTDDSEYTPSDNSECGERGRKSSSRKLNYRDMIGSDSEENEQAEPAKKKKGAALDMNDFLKSSSDGSGTDSSGSGFVVKPEGSGRKVNGRDAVKSDRASAARKINGLPKDGSDIEAVLTDTSKLVSAVVVAQAEPLDDVSLDDDLEDVDDLVSYVTQE